jgi:hypothetical protein
MPTSDADRLPCGTLRDHGPHEWYGQVTDTVYACAGYPPIKMYGTTKRPAQPWPYRVKVD